MTYQIQIAKERRVSTPEEPRQLAIPIGTAIPTGNTVNGMPEYTAGPTQFHTENPRVVEIDGVLHVWRKVDGEEVLVPWDYQNDPQIVMVVEWDQKSPYVIVHKGDYHARTMTYAGWPEITAEEWVEQQNANGEFL